MKIDKSIISKSGLTREEVLALLLIDREVTYREAVRSLEAKGLIERTLEGTHLTISGKRKVSMFEEQEELNYEELAKKLQAIYPSGKKLGTNCMWRDSSAIIARKLRTLVTKYNCKFTEEQAIKATEEYVSSFNGVYTYMKVLKYFLLKNITDNEGEREVSSEFMSRLENEGQENVSNDWTSTLI